MKQPNRKRGAAAIEFSIWLIVLLTLISGVVDWGSFMTTRVIVARAAMDGARVASTIFEPATVSAGSLVVPKAETRAKDVLVGMGLTCDPATCIVQSQYCPRNVAGPCDCGAGCTPPVDSLRVEITYSFKPWFGWAQAPTQITEEFVMAVENQR